MDWVPDVIEGEDMATRRPGCLTITEFLHRHDGTPQEVIKAADGGTEPGPALCMRGCSVRLKETCIHGCPSLLLTLMMYDYRWNDPVG
jgi:hypothetical protein